MLSSVSACGDNDRVPLPTGTGAVAGGYVDAAYMRERSVDYLRFATMSFSRRPCRCGGDGRNRRLMTSTEH